MARPRLSTFLNRTESVSTSMGQAAEARDGNRCPTGYRAWGGTYMWRPTRRKHQRGVVVPVSVCRLQAGIHCGAAAKPERSVAADGYPAARAAVSTFEPGAALLAVWCPTPPAGTGTATLSRAHMHGAMTYRGPNRATRLRKEFIAGSKSGHQQS